jgi:RNA polymerase sigma factor (TIGR02999 family)
MSEVTRILSDVEQGDPRAAERLLPLIYDELRRLAAQKLALERPDHTLQATALVHEAYLRLVEAAPGVQSWGGRGHFFAAAAEAMRRILVENARRKRSLKRGGGLARQDFDAEQLAAPEPNEDLLALDEALNHLAAKHPIKAEVVKLRYFAGLSSEEAALALDISRATVDRYWTYARAWLHREVAGGSPAATDSPPSQEK